MRRWIGSLALVAASACVTRQPMTGQVAPNVDKKLSTFAYIEDGKLVTLIVDTRPTRYREKDAYVPIEIAVANRGVRELSLSRESFTLADETGNRYPCASPKELLASYDFLDLDRNLMELEDIVFNRFGAMTAYPSKLSPTRRSSRAYDSSMVVDAVQLPQYGYFIDMVYFPMPTTGLLGHRFELSMTAPELADPIFVKFEVN